MGSCINILVEDLVELRPLVHCGGFIGLGDNVIQRGNLGFCGVLCGQARHISFANAVTGREWSGTDGLKKLQMNKFSAR